MTSNDVEDDGEFASMASGNARWPSARPRACAYGGHQFGEWAGALGDGRAHTLGRKNGFDVQLKGSGPTPFSRGGDGRAVLRSSIREYVASEAMGALGARTTRALALIATNAGVARMTAANAMRYEPGGVVVRVAESFLRFGSFELANARGDVALVQSLADDAASAFADGEIERFRPKCDGTYGAFVCAVAARTGALVAKWQSLGFVHGVMNTDNMSVLGDTIDYGPFGWMERFDVGYTPNASDLQGERMYTYANQPKAGRWNVERLCDAFNRIASKRDRARALEAFDEAFANELYATFTRKFGCWIRDDDEYEIVRAFHRILQRGAYDFTLSHRALGAFASAVLARGESATAPSLARDMFASVRRAQGRSGETTPDALAVQIAEFGARYAEILLSENGDPELIRAAQDSANPLYIPRNYLLQRAIVAAEREDYEPVRELARVLERPYEEQPGAEAYAAPASAEEHSKVACLS